MSALDAALQQIDDVAVDGDLAATPTVALPAIDPEDAGQRVELPGRAHDLRAAPARATRRRVGLRAARRRPAGALEVPAPDRPARPARPAHRAERAQASLGSRTGSLVGRKLDSFNWKRR
jgi:hypothetical protein